MIYWPGRRRTRVSLTAATVLVVNAVGEVLMSRMPLRTKQAVAAPYTDGVVAPRKAGDFVPILLQKSIAVSREA
jgi:hypothetical protein